MHQHLAVVRLLDEIVEHLLGDFEVGDDAIFHGLDSHDVAGRAAQHLFGLFADGLDLARVLVDGDDRGLIHHDALAPCVDQRVGRPQVDGKIAGKNAEQRPQIVQAG